MINCSKLSDRWSICARQKMIFENIYKSRRHFWTYNRLEAHIRTRSAPYASKPKEILFSYSESARRIKSVLQSSGCGWLTLACAIRSSVCIHGGEGILHNTLCGWVDCEPLIFKRGYKGEIRALSLLGLARRKFSLQLIPVVRDRAFRLGNSLHYH